MSKHIIFFILLLLSFDAAGQSTRLAAFGFQIEPIIPSGLFRINTDEVLIEDVLFTTEPLPGIAYGGMLSVSLSPRFQIETGINFISRDYRISVDDRDLNRMLQFRVVNFEIPVTVTFYVRIGENIYLAQNAGLSLQVLPSDLSAIDLERDASGNVIYRFEQESRRQYWLMPAFKGALGVEYRTENSGYFYVGPTYRLFSLLYRTQLFYDYDPNYLQNIEVKMIGDYFGITVRYVFPPSELKKREKKKNK